MKYWTLFITNLCKFSQVFCDLISDEHFLIMFRVSCEELSYMKLLSYQQSHIPETVTHQQTGQSPWWVLEQFSKQNYALSRKYTPPVTHYSKVIYLLWNKVPENLNLIYLYIYIFIFKEVITNVWRKNF